MKNWKQYWDVFPGKFNEKDFFQQVGKTVKKIPISQDLFDEIISSIVNNLDIKLDDDVLDMCCGNGVITAKVSNYCKSIVGVDYSKKLIDIASKYHMNSKIRYFNVDVCSYLIQENQKFDKIYMYESLQHFNLNEFRLLISRVTELFNGDVNLFFCSVPDKSKKWLFYNTIKRKISYLWHKINGDECIGVWWSRSDIEKICNDADLGVRFIRQSTNLHTSHYRFDFMVSNRRIK